MTKTTIEALRELLERTVPFLRDAAESYEDDGGNEPLELARDIEQALASPVPDESPLPSASSGFGGAGEAALAALSQGEAVPAIEVFRIAGGDVECSPNPTAAQALDCLRDLRECYDEVLTHPEAQGEAVAEVGPAWSLVWVGQKPLAELLREHPEVRIGTKLYTAAPKPVEGVTEPWYGHRFCKGRDGRWRCADGCGPVLVEEAQQQEPKEMG